MNQEDSDADADAATQPSEENATVSDIDTKAERERTVEGDVDSQGVDWSSPSLQGLREILLEDYHTRYKHDKLDVSEYMDRFEALRVRINAITERAALRFPQIKETIAGYFPRGKKDAKTKERVDEIIARVYTEATRRMMALMARERATAELLKIATNEFIDTYPELSPMIFSRQEDLQHVIAFYRAILVAHRFVGIPCQGFRNHFMRIGTLLENSGCFYATGGRPAKTTLLRKELIDRLTESSRSRRVAKKDNELLDDSQNDKETIAREETTRNESFQSLLNVVEWEFPLVCHDLEQVNGDSKELLSSQKPNSESGRKRKNEPNEEEMSFLSTPPQQSYIKECSPSSASSGIELLSQASSLNFPFDSIAVARTA